jgi:serine/threonine protein kinase
MAGAAARKKRVGRYEVGRTIGQGTFAKVKFAVDAETGAAVAMKVLDKETILSHRMLHQVHPHPLSPHFRYGDRASQVKSDCYSPFELECYY